MAALPSGFRFGGLSIQLGPLALNQVDSSGVYWYCSTLEGWDSASTRADLTQREADHGAWAAPVYLGERPITLGGTIYAPDTSTLDTALEQLRAAVSLSDTPLVVNESLPKQALVHRSGQLLITYVTGHVATWSAMVTAADPRRYELTQRTATTGLPNSSGGLTFPITFPITFSATSSSGSLTATNAGTFETRPILTITGPVTGPQVTAQYADGSIRQLIYGLDLAAGDQLVIDTDAHTAVLNGQVSRRPYLSVPSGWPTIPAGASVAYQFRTTGAYNATASLTASWRSAWM